MWMNSLLIMKKPVWHSKGKIMGNMKKEDFADPKGVLEYNEAQSPLWFWNDRLEKAELEKQLSLMTEKGDYM